MPPREPMFHVKICGVTSADDARMVAAAGADAIGINFVAGSPRCVSIATAREVARALPDDVLVVGVFAGMPAAEIRRIVAEVGLDAVQLHGHLSGAGVVDPPEVCGGLAPLAVIRAVRLGPDGLAAARAWLAAAAAAGHAATMAVVDAAVTAGTSAGQLGGTGATIDWSGLAVAGDLGMTERSLHRKLAEENTSFGDILDRLRRSLADECLREAKLSTKQISFLLGYADQSSFGAAYRRWTGLTPKAARARTG